MCLYQFDLMQSRTYVFFIILIMKKVHADLCHRHSVCPYSLVENCYYLSKPMNSFRWSRLNAHTFTSKLHITRQWDFRTCLIRGCRSESAFTTSHSSSWITTTHFIRKYQRHASPKPIVSSNSPFAYRTKLVTLNHFQYCSTCHFSLFDHADQQKQIDSCQYGFQYPIHQLRFLLPSTHSKGNHHLYHAILCRIH